MNNSDNPEINAKHIAKLNSCLHTYKIHTEMTQKSWNFFFNGTPISLEEAIRKLPDDVLFRQTPSISRNTPTSEQKKPIKPSPTVAKNNLSQTEYLSQLEDLCYKFGDDAKRHLADIQKQTGYNRKKVESDLEKVRSQLKSLPLQQQPQNQPKLSIEEELLNYLKAQPICWEFPLTTQDKALNQFCEALVFSKDVTGVGSNEAIKNLELTIQKKRARNPRLADHNTAMEGNILAILYEYSYLMHIFHALDNMKFDTTKVDISKLWLLIQQDCNARINNLDEEKRKNPTIQIVLDKYNYDTQINRLKVLNDATGREMDYIIAFIMAYSLLTIISILLGNPKLLQPLKPYPADDIAGMMNALINASVGLRFTAYSR